MQKTIDIKNRVVDLYDVDTGQHEDEIIRYLDKNMKVRFHSAVFNNNKYVFTGSPKDGATNTITVTGYRRKSAKDAKVSIDIG